MKKKRKYKFQVDLTGRGNSRKEALRKAVKKLSKAFGFHSKKEKKQ